MIAILADIHGNYPALQAVISKVEAVGCNKIISLGDVAGYYPYVNECIEKLRKFNVIHIMGNHDFYLLTGTTCPRSSSANRCLAYQKSIITSKNMSWLSKARTAFVTKDLSIVHGSWENPLDGYLYKVPNEYFSSLNQSFFFCAHTHVQKLVNLGSKTFCNPGSVGQPRDGDYRAAFAIYNSGNVALYRVDYDTKIIIKKMKELSFENKYLESIRTGTRIGGKIDSIAIG